MSSRWLATEGNLESEIAANKSKLNKCFDTVVLDDQDLILSNQSSGHSSTIGLPTGSGTGVFLAHNSVQVTGNQISFGLSNSSGTHDDTLYPAAWSSQIPDSLKTIVVDGSNIRGKRHDNSFSGSIPYADPSDVTTLQSEMNTVETDLQALEGEVDSKCLKSLEMKNGVLKGKRMNGDFTGNIPVILTSTLDAATAALNYIKNSDLTTALSSYYDQATSDSRYVNTSDLATEISDLTYQTLAQIQAIDHRFRPSSSNHRRGKELQKAISLRNTTCYWDCLRR